MRLFDLFRAADINAGVKQFREQEGALLLDVRTEEEYAEGHIPGSLNLPLSRLANAGHMIPEHNTPIYVHCLSGARSRQGAAVLKRMGYNNVTDLGGVAAYKGKLEV